MLEQASQPEKALLLFGRYGERLNRLTLASNSLEKWLLPFTQVLPTANSFPRLNILYVSSGKKSQVPHEFVQWLVTVAPDRPQPSGSTSSEDTCTETSQQAIKTSTILARLRILLLYNVTLQPQDWELLIKAIDLSVLEDLHLHSTNFSSTQLDLLLERIAAADAKSVSLKLLQIGSTELLVDAERPALQTRILKAAPQMIIVGL
ncbi:MAG: hypothetical protein J3Q66DRAFT_328256 [Benniella sp.]|nr:MAG: hypothetical protein J3Q66DRAFT_328256 [Benniella sp.]